MNIAVFCSAGDVAEKYAQPATGFVDLMLAGKHTLIWGGSDTGLMKVVASRIRAGGGKIVGISVEMLKDVARTDADEMIITKDLSERKAMMLKRSDAIVVLPGGVGTLDEVTEAIETKKHHLHHKPIVFLNTDNFYEGLKSQLQRMQADGFLTRPLEEFVRFVDTPEEAMRYITEHGN